MAKTLGKGLGALIKSYGSDSKEPLLDNNILIKNIIPNKNQPRKKFNEKEMKQLTHSIKMHGVIQPISIRKIDNKKYELIAGERRFRASHHAGLKTIPAYIINIKDNAEMLEYALIENIQRVDLNPMEEAEGYAILSGKHNLTHAKIAEYVSKSRSEITNKLRLLKLPPIIQESLKLSHIEYGHARSLLSIKESLKVLKIFKQIIIKKLNVRQTELLVKNSLNDRTVKSSKIQSSIYPQVETKLQNYLNAKIEIINNKNKKGKISIYFKNNNHLQSIVKKIKK